MTDNFIQTVRLLLKERRLDAALALWGSRLDSSNLDEMADAFSARADVNWVAGNHGKAITDILRASALQPLNSGHRYQACLWLIDLGSFADALSAADELIELEIRKGSVGFLDAARFFKAYSLLRIGQAEECINVLESVVDDKPIWVEGRLCSKSDLAVIAHDLIG